MYFEESGSGSHAVLLFHGTPAPPETMLPLARHLSAGRRVLVPHFPGYGRSTGLEVLSSGRFEPILDAELRRRGVESCDVVGFSGGAYRALSFACRSGIPVRRVVSLAGFAAFSEAEREGMRGFAAALRAGASLAGVLAPRMLRAETIANRPHVAAAVETWRSAIEPRKLAEELDDQAGAQDLLPLLSRIRTRILARVGSDDVVTPPAHSEAIARAAPGGTLQIVEGAPHGLLVEDRDPTFRAVGEFLD